MLKLIALHGINHLAARHSAKTLLIVRASTASVIWIKRDQFNAIPIRLDEAAFVDGLST